MNEELAGCIGDYSVATTQPPEVHIVAPRWLALTLANTVAMSTEFALKDPKCLESSAMSVLLPSWHRFSVGILSSTRSALGPACLGP